ncbi:MAG: PEP-CTERM sorting domain-containing protein [Gemmatimonas sp.]
MKRFLLTCAAAAWGLAANVLPAQIVTIPSSKLQIIPSLTTSFLYTGLDNQGTTMLATASNGGTIKGISGALPGLHFGSDDQSGQYTFSFNAPISFFEFHFTAQSTGNFTGAPFSEIFNSFAVNSGTAALAYTNIDRTAWDGFNLTSTFNLDNGKSLLAISVGAGQSFTSVSFNHVQTGQPAGSVIEEIRYERGNGAVAVVPEPSTYAMMFAGLLGMAVVARRKVSDRASVC